jgi:hypothetical protein
MTVTDTINSPTAQLIIAALVISCGLSLTGLKQESVKMHIGMERRESQRFQCSTAILHNTCPPDFFYRGTMYNFSAGGLYFESDEDLQKGDEITVSIKNPPPQFLDKNRQYFDVKIMWCRVLQGASYQVGYGSKLIPK